MLSQWSWLLFLLALAASTIMLEERALPKVTSASGAQASPAEKARQYFSAEEIAGGRVYARGRYILVFLRLADPGPIRGPDPYPAGCQDP